MPASAEPISTPAPPEHPGASTRRGFLVLVTAACGAAVALVAAVPGVGFLVAPALQPAPASDFVRVASLSDLPPGAPVRADVVATRHDAWNRFDGVRLGAVWLLRAGPGTAVRAFSTVCPHLGCAVDYDPADRHFACPCHGSLFGLDGARLAGPAPRSLDSLEVRVDGDDVSVRYRRFREGVPDKVPA